MGYVGTARNLLDGYGYTPPPGTPPLGNFPPLYPLVLAAVGAFGPDPLTVARYVGPLVFGATVLAVGLLVRRLGGSSQLSFAAQLLVLSGTDFLSLHTAALSEPLFLLLVVLALLALAPTLAARRQGALVAAAVFTGAACLTRYVGLALVAAGAVALVLLTRGQRRAWMRAVALVAFALAPLATWLVWVHGKTGRFSNRTAVLHVPPASYALRGIGGVASWIVPDVVPWPGRAAGAAGVILAAGALAWRTRKEGDRRLAALLTFAVVAYVGALVVDRFLFEVTGRLDARFLLPVHALAIALAMWILRTVDLRRAHLARVMLSAVVGLQVASGVLWMHDALTDAEFRPGGFASPSWRHSMVIDQVRTAAPTSVIYTNAADAVWFLTGRLAAPIPEKRIFLTGERNPAYDAELAAMREQLRGGLLVYLTRSPARRVFLPTPDELARQLGLQLVTRDAVGEAYRLS